MARPAAVAARGVSADLAGAGAAVVMLLVLAALLLWPLLDVVVVGFVVGLLTPPPALALVRDTLAVALGATVGALGLAAVPAAAVRAGIPGGDRVVAICRAGVLMPPFVAPLALLVIVGRDGLLVGAGAGLHGPAAIAIAQAVAFLPHAFVLVLRALAAVSADAEQAAELLGASAWTVLRRVTLGLARPGLVTAALVVLALCLADVASPLLVGSPGPAPATRMVLGGFVVFAGAHWTAAAAAAAVALSALTLVVAAAGCTWRYVTAPLAPGSVRPTGQRPTGAVRIVLFGLAWLVVVVLASPWVVVPLAALSAARGVSPAHWAALVGGAPLVNTLLLGLGVAFMGTGLALAVASIAARRRGVLGASVTALARVPVAVPGVVGGIGYLLAFGAPEGDLVLVALLVAVWELPLMLRVAGNVLARADRSTELAALTLGADRLTMVRRVVLPGLRPAVAWLLCHGFAAGVAAVGTVVILAEQTGVKLGVLDMLHAASRGAVGAACAVATVLLVLAGGAMLLGRVVAGRESVPTLLA